MKWSTKCERRSHLFNDASAAIAQAQRLANSQSKEFGVFSRGVGRFHVRRIGFNRPGAGALEICKPMEVA